MSAVFLSNFSSGQNLVPNASFENYKKLPCVLNESYVQDLLEHWFQPINTTTDYWSNLSQEQCYLNPASVGSGARSGEGMVGIITAHVFNNFGNPYRFTYQEYVGVKLTTTLRTGGFYHARVFAKAREIYSPQIPILTADNLGLVFTDSLILFERDTDSPDHLILEPQVESKELLGPTWQKVEGCFIADKSHEYLYIGNFRNIDSTQIGGTLTGSEQAFAYYFIDDVLVEELPYKVNLLQSGADICYKNGYVELNAFVEGATGYRWQDGSTNAVKNVPISPYPTFYVDILFNECKYRHTFNLNKIPRIDLGLDTALCVGERLRIANDSSDVEVTWWDGSIGGEKNITSPGEYSAYALIGNCILRDTVTVSFSECPGFVPNVITPNGDMFNDFLTFENIDDRTWSLQVLNRWGEQVFESLDYENDWDGGDLPPGIYYFRLFSTDLRKDLKGWVSIIK